MLPVKTYSIKVDGYGPHLYSARTPAKAKAQAWRAYRLCHDISFGDFLLKLHLYRVANPEGVGDRILVNDRPATRCVGRSDHYVWFMYDDSDVVLCSHPADVTPIRPAGDGGATGREG